MVRENTADHFRQRAAEMRTEAQYVVDPTLRKELMRLAAGWDRLAGHGQALSVPPEKKPSNTGVTPNGGRAAADSTFAH